MSEFIIFTTKQAAERLNVSHRSLEKWRVTGGGPVFVRMGSRVGYREEDLATWVSSNRRQSTSDTGPDSGF